MINLLKKHFRIISAIIILGLVALIGIFHTIVVPGGTIMNEECCAGAEPGSELYDKCQELSVVEEFIEKCFGLE